MPEFILNDDKPLDVDAFVSGYVEAMFFTNGDTGDENEDKLNELGTSRLTRASVEEIKADCEAFLALECTLNNVFPVTVRKVLELQDHYDEEQAGRDFWFTRQGHGVGYWDREELTSTVGQAFSDAANRAGGAHVEVYRGWIYYHG